ncbi:DUF4255 domain-containing protein [Actinomadura sp. 6N118]|uniref:DUF4255 domain-containing protein n=1 Tax=Actinomadura sp. 6N118 TaxID=3375151 RepID=UPI00379DD19A
MTPARAFLAVDETLKKLTDTGLSDAGITQKPAVTVGPLDRDDDGPRLNWFLYRITPNAAFRNMEHPRNGTRTARGAPPLAVRLHYLLSAYGAAPTSAGDSEELIHVALAAVMRRLHESPIVGPGSPFLPTPPPVLLEPIRITMDDFDMENVSRIWTAATKPLRLSIAYSVGLVVVEQQRTHQPGPPVTGPPVITVGRPGPRLGAPDPARLGGDVTTKVTVSGAGAGASFRLAADPDDPAGAPPEGWPMTTVTTGPDARTMRLPRHDLVPGIRSLDVVALAEGLPAGQDSTALTIVPTIRTVPGGGALTVGAPVTLATAHSAPGTELFLDAVPVPVTSVTATSVEFEVPDAPGEHTLTLRSRHVTGDPVPVRVTP